MGEGIEADWPSDDIVPVSEEEPHGEVEQSSAVDEVTDRKSVV